MKHVYRVLLSRGLKGCYVYFLDPATRHFVESRMEMAYRRDATEGVRLAADRPITLEELRDLLSEIPRARDVLEDAEAMGDVLSQLLRSDYREWRDDPELRERLCRSLRGVLVGRGWSESSDMIAAALLAQLAEEGC